MGKKYFKSMSFFLNSFKTSYFMHLTAFVKSLSTDDCLSQYNILVYLVLHSKYFLTTFHLFIHLKDKMTERERKSDFICRFIPTGSEQVGLGPASS